MPGSPPGSRRRARRTRRQKRHRRTPTTVTTIEQAYYCVLAHYYAAPVLDDQVLLADAFAGFTQELDRLGLDQPDATMPALTGHRDQDWAALAAVYQSETAAPPSS